MHNNYNIRKILPGLECWYIEMFMIENQRNSSLGMTHVVLCCKAICWHICVNSPVHSTTAIRLSRNRKKRHFNSHSYDFLRALYSFNSLFQIHIRKAKLTLGCLIRTHRSLITHWCLRERHYHSLLHSLL